MTVHIPQADSWGCGAAALAMILGKTYDEIKAHFPSEQFGERGKGIWWMTTDEFLCERGFAVRRVFRKRSVRFPTLDSEQPDRLPWPPGPFAPIHLCEVLASESAPGTHFVVMLDDGTVLDPLSPEPRRLTDYPRVNNVAGVYRVAEVETPIPTISLQ